ncbi:MAG: CAP domain-containing protein [Thermoguttaceae bacterium]|nr:CAP domain-containing protein [Thermoguttaceae bacterium]
MMDKRKIMAVAAATIAALTIPQIVNAQSGFFFSRVRTRVLYAGANRCSGGACSIGVSTPAPCEPITTTCPGGACSLDVSTPEPCEPVTTTCPGGACSLDVSTPEPCEPVTTTCPGGACSLDALLSEVNKARAAYRLPPLAVDERLRVEASERVRICAASGRLRHGGGAEVLAMNSGGINAAIGQWLNSPPHRALILNAGYRYAGVAVTRDARGRAWCAVRFR